jgi:hypothetical protein
MPVRYSDRLVPQFVEVALIWFVISKYLPSFLPTKRYVRLHLPFSGSLGPRFPTFPVQLNHRYYARLRLPNARLRFVRYSLSSPDTLYCPSVFVIPFGLSGKRGLSSPKPGFCLYDRLPQPFCTGKHSDLPSSQVTPMITCPVLRPRWCPHHLPWRNVDCCLPSSQERWLSPSVA